MSGVPAFSIKYDKTNAQKFVKDKIEANSTEKTVSGLISQKEFNDFLKKEVKDIDQNTLEKIDAVIFANGKTALSFKELADKLVELDTNKDGELTSDEVMKKTEGVTPVKPNKRPASPSDYTIKKGDTLSEIAQEFKKYKALKGKKMAEIMELIKETSPEIFLDKDAPDLDRIAAGKKIDVKALLQKAAAGRKVAEDKEVSDADDPTETDEKNTPEKNTPKVRKNANNNQAKSIDGQVKPIDGANEEANIQTGLNNTQVQSTDSTSDKNNTKPSVNNVPAKSNVPVKSADDTNAELKSALTPQQKEMIQDMRTRLIIKESQKSLLNDLLKGILLPSELSSKQKDSLMAILYYRWRNLSPEQKEFLQQLVMNKDKPSVIITG